MNFLIYDQNMVFFSILFPLVSPLSSYSALLTAKSLNVLKLAIIDPPKIYIFYNKFIKIYMITNPCGIFSMRVSIHSNTINICYCLRFNFDISFKSFFEPSYQWRTTSHNNIIIQIVLQVLITFLNRIVSKICYSIRFNPSKLRLEQNLASIISTVMVNLNNRAIWELVRAILFTQRIWCIKSMLVINCNCAHFLFYISCRFV